MPAANKKNYTNADIIKRLDDMGSRIEAIETWKIAQEAGKAAVDEYRRQENATNNNKNRNDAYASIKELMPYIIALLVAAAAVLYLHAGNK